MSTAALPKLIDCAGSELGHYVYVLDTDQGVKVGISASMTSRIADLSRGAGLPPDSIRVVAVLACDSRAQAVKVERAAHWFLRDTRTVGEWFHCHPLEAKDAVLRGARGPVPLEAMFGRLHDWEKAA